MYAKSFVVSFLLLFSPPDFSGPHVTRFLVLYVCFVDRCLSFCTFSFGHFIVYSSSIYGVWLPLWYLQTILTCVICVIYVNLLMHVPIMHVLYIDVWDRFKKKTFRPHRWCNCWHARLVCGRSWGWVQIVSNQRL